MAKSRLLMLMMSSRYPVLLAVVAFECKIARMPALGKHCAQQCR